MECQQRTGSLGLRSDEPVKIDSRLWYGSNGTHLDWHAFGQAWFRNKNNRVL